jgi:pyrroloquinoline quinone biosynthesis protein B
MEASFPQGKRGSNSGGSAVTGNSLPVALAVLVASCSGLPAPTAPTAPNDRPYVIVLGTAQDGGLPQIGCREPRCERARENAGERRFATSLLLADPSSGRRWLFDAGPDLREQFELARAHPATRRENGPRPPLFDGIFLTHAHSGHYAGLLELGREAYGERGLAVHASSRMCGFLATNGPWSLLVDTGAIELREIAAAGEIELAPGLSVRALRVPHRDELSDTLAFVVRGPERALLYLPDIDKWELWDRRLEDVLAEVDVALLDGTFFADGEVAGRSMAEIPHPFVVETLERLRDDPPELRAKVVFTHLNHTNPACDRGSAARRAIEAAGMRVAREGELLEL